MDKNLPINVLITSAGGASAINVIQALRSQREVAVRLVAVDVDSKAAGLYLADAGYHVPRVNNPNFIATILNICQREAIRVVMPILSVEMPIFAAHSAEFEACGMSMIISTPEVIHICNDKWLTYEFFRRINLSTAPTWNLTTLPEPSELPYPVMVKPTVGSGSRHTYRADNSAQLAAFLTMVPDPVVQKFIEGVEYTVDVLADKQSNLLAAIPRERTHVSGGKSIQGYTISKPHLLEDVTHLIKAINLVGAGNVQAIAGPDGLYFTEINARFAAGGLPLAVAAGANLPLMLLKMALGQVVAPVDDYEVGLIMSRYLTNLFLRSAGSTYQLVTNSVSTPTDLAEAATTWAADQNLDSIAIRFLHDEGFEAVLADYRWRTVSPFLQGSHALDVGCGAGLFTTWLAGYFEQVMAVDGSELIVTKAKQRVNSPNVTFRVAHLETFDPEQKFDTILISHVLEHVDDPIQVLRRAINWLKPDGVVIGTVPNALGLHKRIGQKLGLISDLYALTPGDHFKGHKRVYDLNRFKSDFETCGYEILHAGGIFLKPLSNEQMVTWDLKLCNALYELGRELPDYCSSIYICARPKRGHIADIRP